MINDTLPDWCEPLFDTELRYVAIKGGRGGAKSTCVALALLYIACNAPTRILCTREIQDSIKYSVKMLLDDLIRKRGLTGFFRSTEDKIIGKNGSLFIFSGLKTDPEKIKSLEGVDICWVEEAQKISMESLKNLTPTIRKSNARIFFTWNPRLKSDPVDDLFCRENPPPRSSVQHVNFDRNPWFDQTSLIQEMEYDKLTDYDKYVHVWLGGYLEKSEARVLKNFTIKEFETPGNVLHMFGADWGFANDPTTIVRCHVQGRDLYVDYAVGKTRCEIIDTPSLFLQIPEVEKYAIRADSARPETISYMQSQKFKIFPATKGPGSIKDGISFISTFNLIIHPRCQGLIDDIPFYVHKTDKQTGKILDDIDDGHDDYIDALRYAVEPLSRMSRNKTTKNSEIRYASQPMHWMY